MSNASYLISRPDTKDILEVINPVKDRHRFYQKIDFSNEQKTYHTLADIFKSSEERIVYFPYHALNSAKDLDDKLRDDFLGVIRAGIKEANADDKVAVPRDNVELRLYLAANAYYNQVFADSVVSGAKFWRIIDSIQGMDLSATTIEKPNINKLRALYLEREYPDEMYEYLGLKNANINPEPFQSWKVSRSTDKIEVYSSGKEKSVPLDTAQKLHTTVFMLTNGIAERISNLLQIDGFWAEGSMNHNWHVAEHVAYNFINNLNITPERLVSSTDLLAVYSNFAKKRLSIPEDASPSAINDVYETFSKLASIEGKIVEGINASEREYLKSEYASDYEKAVQKTKETIQKHINLILQKNGSDWHFRFIRTKPEQK